MIEVERVSAFERHTSSVLAVGVALLIIAGLNQLFSPEFLGIRSLDTGESSRWELPVAGLIAPPDLLREVADKAVPKISLADQLPEWLERQVGAGEFQLARKRLLDSASQAVQQADDRALARSLFLLGWLALEAQDTESAHAYLRESLGRFSALEDTGGVVHTQMQLGRMHVIDRRLARRAALAHDAGLIARNHLAMGRIRQAIPEFEYALETNLALNRFAAAALDYEMLGKAAEALGDHQQALDATSEAARLLAQTGRHERAGKLLQRAEALGMGTDALARLTHQVDTAVAGYESGHSALQRGKDFQNLYHQMLSAGDPVSAWQFRLKAEESHSRASRHAVYRRQQGVLALLYNSNDDISLARRYLQDAQLGLLTSGADTGDTNQTDLLLTQINALIDEAI